MAAELERILESLEKGADPNGILYTRRGQRRVREIDSAMDVIEEQLASLDGPEDPEYGQISDQLDRISRILRILQQGRAVTGDRSIHKFKRPWPKGRKLIPHIVRHRALKERMIYAAKPAKKHPENMRKEKSREDILTKSEIGQAEKDLSSVWYRQKKIDNVYSSLFFGLDNYSGKRWLEKAADILDTEENTSNILGRLELLERNAREKAESARALCRQLEEKLQAGSVADEAQQDAIRELIEKERARKYDPAQATVFEGGITPVTEDTVDLIEAVKAVGHLEKVTGRTKVYLELLDQVFENLCENRLEAPEGIGESAFDVGQAAGEIEERLALLNAHREAYMYFLNELEKIQKIPEIQRQIQAEYDNECTTLQKKASVYLKREIESRKELGDTIRGIGRLLKRIEKAREFDAGGLVKPKPVVRTNTYSGLKDFLTLLQRTSIMVQGNSPDEEYEVFVKLMHDAIKARDISGPDDGAYRRCVINAGGYLDRAIRFARQFQEMDSADKRVAPLLKNAMKEEDFDQDLVRKYTSWRQDLGRESGRWNHFC